MHREQIVKRERERERERENQQDATFRYLLSTLSQHVSGIIMPIFRRTQVFVLLKMGIMMPETCWDSVDNKHLNVASCWFSLWIYVVSAHQSTRYRIPENWKLSSDTASYFQIVTTFYKHVINTEFTLILNIRTVRFYSEMSVRFSLQKNTSNWSNNVISIKSPNDRNCNWLWQRSLVIYTFFGYTGRAMLENFWDTGWKYVAIPVSKINFN